MLTWWSTGRAGSCIFAVLLAAYCIGGFNNGLIVGAIESRPYFPCCQQPEEIAFSSEYASGASTSWKVPSGGLKAREDSVGEQGNFWIQDFTDFTHYQVHATLLAIGDYSAVFITNTCISSVGESAAVQFAENIRDAFDSTIYPKITDLAGHPNGTLGDIDDDPRIVILLSTNPVSYYSQYNELPASPSNPYSNECEMIYIYYWTWLLPTIAHEFHHLIWFNTEMDEQQFALEGLATYAEFHAGYLDSYENLEPRVPDFLTHPEDSLLYWNGFGDAGLPSAIDYGGAYLFTFYIAEKYGVDILRDLITEPTDGPAGIEATLQAAGHDLSFNDLYLDWMTAITLDELGFDNNLYGFEALDAQIHRNLLQPIPLFQYSFSLRYYGIQTYEIIFPSDITSVRIQKPSNTTIGLSIAVHDAFGWQIDQQILSDEQTNFIDNIEGAGIDALYIITTFLSNTTPPGHREYGLGPSTIIQISLTTDKPGIPFIDPSTLVIIILLSVALVGVIIIITLKQSWESTPLDDIKGD